MRSKRGITLVSLVVTIIVLIILAGVSINLTLGENGIITMAKRARENMEFAKTDEERQLNELYEQIVTEGGLSGNASDDAIIRLAEFKREIASALTDIGVETAENADISTMASNIRSLIGTSTADKVNYDNINSNLAATNVQGAVDELDNEIDELKDSSIKYKIIRYNDIEMNYNFNGRYQSDIIYGNSILERAELTGKNIHSLQVLNVMLENGDSTVDYYGKVHIDPDTKHIYGFTINGSHNYKCHADLQIGYL